MARAQALVLALTFQLCAPETETPAGKRASVGPSSPSPGAGGVSRKKVGVLGDRTWRACSRCVLSVERVLRGLCACECVLRDVQEKERCVVCVHEYVGVNVACIKAWGVRRVSCLPLCSVCGAK